MWLADLIGGGFRKPARVGLLSGVSIGRELEEGLLRVGGEELVDRFVVNVNREEDYRDCEIVWLERAFVWGGGLV